MTRILTKFYKDQYGYFKEQLESSWGLSQKRIDDYDAQLKPIHKRFLSLACASTIVGHRAPRNDYIQRVIEASHLSLVLAVKGIENPSCVLLRQCIELVLKHVYFSSHPVEYEWVRSRADCRELNFQTLLEYITKTNECRNLPEGNNICKSLNAWFGTLSRYVHVHARGFMGYNKIGSSYKPNSEIIKRLNQRTKEIWPRLIAFLILYFTKRYLRASQMEKDLIRAGLSKNLRTKIDNYLIDLA